MKYIVLLAAALLFPSPALACSFDTDWANSGVRLEFRTSTTNQRSFASLAMPASLFWA